MASPGDKVIKSAGLYGMILTGMDLASGQKHEKDL
jgi:hypothetical protein